MQSRRCLEVCFKKHCLLQYHCNGYQLLPTILVYWEPFKQHGSQRYLKAPPLTAMPIKLPFHDSGTYPLLWYQRGQFQLSFCRFPLYQQVGVTTEPWSKPGINNPPKPCQELKGRIFAPVVGTLLASRRRFSKVPNRLRD